MKEKPQKQIRIIDKGDTISLLAKEGDKPFEEKFLYEKDSRCFIPGSILKDILRFVENGYQLVR